MSLLKSIMRRLHAPIYESRLRELVRLILPHLRDGDRVLDVGCGFGALGRALMDSPACPKNVAVLGLERAARGGEMIPVRSYDGGPIPFADSSFDLVILADVLHHEPDPHRLIDECARVSRRLLIVKDHQLNGPLARQRVSFIDWAANAPYGVPCLYRYNTPAQWTDSHQRHGLAVDQELTSMNLYPPIVNFLFGRRLQYLAVLKVPRPSRRGVVPAQAGTQ